MVGIVCYRDYSDSEQFIVHDFTSDKEAFISKLSGISASGGGDLPEDVLGGMEKALTAVSWTDAPGNTQHGKTVSKVIFHIGDAPAHGKEFQDPGESYTDNHLDKHSTPRPYKEICQDLAGSKIDYYFAQVKSSGGKVSSSKTACNSLSWPYLRRLRCFLDSSTRIA